MLCQARSLGGRPAQEQLFLFIHEYFHLHWASDSAPFLFLVRPLPVHLHLPHLNWQASLELAADLVAHCCIFNTQFTLNKPRRTQPRCELAALSTGKGYSPIRYVPFQSEVVKNVSRHTGWAVWTLE